MPADYVQVLADLDEQIRFHEKELKELQAARPAIVSLRNKFSPVINLPYAGMGATAAIRELLSSSNAWFSQQEILEHLVSKGWTTESADKAKTVSSTLSQMKDELDKRGDMWRAKKWEIHDWEQRPTGLSQLSQQ